MSRGDFLGKDARLSKEPSALLAETAFAEELSRAGRLYGLFDFADCAHLIALAKAGAVPRDVAHSIASRIMELRHTGARPETFDPATGDVYNNRDAFLMRRLGADYGHVHFGRSRREATNIAWLLDLRVLLAEAVLGIADLVEALGERSSELRSRILPDYTYLQRAHPTTVGHYLTSFAYPLTRDLERLEQALRMADLSPAGIGSVNGTSYDIDRVLLQELLGFSGLLVNTRDGMWAADLPGAVMGALAVAGVTIDRLAEDLQIWATSEFAFIELDDAHCRTSVIMPQKKNPYALAGLRGFTRTLIGSLVSALTTNMTPTGQPDNRVYAYGALPEAAEAMGRWSRLLAEIVRKMQVRESKSGFFKDSDFVYATEVIDYLSLNAGMTNRAAHHLVGGIITKIAAAPPPEDQVLEAFMTGLKAAGIAEPVSEAVRTLADPALIIARRTGRGSANPDEVARMADDVRDIAAVHKSRISHDMGRWSETELEKKLLNHMDRMKHV